MSKADDIVAIGAPFPQIETVSARDRFRILVTWQGGEQTIVDLAPSIFTFKVYAPLRTDCALFESVHVVDGTVIAWGRGDAIDMHVSEIERLAAETMGASDFQAFLDEMRLTRDAAAAQLGVSRRMVGYYVTGHAIPRHIALACAHLRTSRKAKVWPTTAPGKT